MLIERKSTLTGNFNTMDIAISNFELFQVEHRNSPIQDIIPHIPKEQREFLISGITPEEWNKYFNIKEDE